MDDWQQRAIVAENQNAELWARIRADETVIRGLESEVRYQRERIGYWINGYEKVRAILVEAAAKLETL